MAVQEVNYRSFEIEQKRARERATAEKLRTEAKRQRLELLQQDNHFEDPHKNLIMAKNIPTFTEDAERKQIRKSRKGKLSEKWKKTFAQVLQDEERFWINHGQTCLDPSTVCNYFTAEAPRSRYPGPLLCSVCSFPCNMKCITCEERFCSKKCLEIHKDTRCMKRVM
ncbi:zinc finger HIT domain-containing protein 1-like [Paramacrobiotus metropolitanus]|uniref:zinc finger HIT domain-containing protein 1-like n=1 Tax=Paramacrobiotus metropolitanus TaxID=2943436 RepID=UPI0024465056|nr:zinc finger HIT domain-containing protein 1-like [Paramacrobiotus metropolitanus]